MAGEKILIVDDDPCQRRILSAALEGAGHAVVEAADGVEAVDRVAEEDPDLVLLDLDLPRLDGYGVCRRLREDPATRFLPIIMVTVIDSLPGKLRAIECGVDDYLNKPVRVAELLTRVRSLLVSRKRILELENATLVLEAIARAIERRDPYTARHSAGVRDHAVALGRALGLPEADIDALRLGAALHDVGKIGIPDAILLKPGPLTPEEYDVIKTHPVIGAELCRPMRSLAHVLPLIRHHHERLDGSGYPDGLSGADIPKAVRILSVADVYDALTSRRRYREGLLPEKAIAILEEEARRGWWDAEIVQTWKGLALATPAGTRG